MMCTWDESKDPRDSTLCEEESTHRVTYVHAGLPARLHCGDTVCDFHARILSTGDFDTEAL